MLGTFQVGRFPIALAFDGQWLWVANHGDKTVMKLSLHGSLIGEVELNLRPAALAVVGDDLWVLTSEANYPGASGAITVLSSSLETVATYGVNQRGAPMLALVFDGEAVWMANDFGNVTRMGVDGTALGDFEPEYASVATLAFDGRNVWAAGSFSGSGGQGVVRLAPDGTTLQRLGTAIDPFGMAWDGVALWVTVPDTGEVVRLELRDPPAPALPLVSEPEELVPSDADLSRYLLSQEQIASMPGSVVWSGPKGRGRDRDFAGFFDVGSYRYGIDVVGSIEVNGRGSAEAPLLSGTVQTLYQFKTQAEAVQLMGQLRRPDAPLLASLSVGQWPVEFKVQDSHGDARVWLEELDPSVFGPGTFVVEVSSVIPARTQQERGFGGVSRHVFHGWLRYGNLVSLIGVARGIDIGSVGASDFLRTHQGPYYTMDEFQALLATAYRNLKEGATRPPLSITLPPTATPHQPPPTPTPVSRDK